MLYHFPKGHFRQLCEYLKGCTCALGKGQSECMSQYCTCIFLTPELLFGNYSLFLRQSETEIYKIFH